MSIHPSLLARLILPCALAALVVACDDGASSADPSLDGAPEPEPSAEPEPGAEPEPAPADCVPDATQWDAVARPLIETWCGGCHGETPQFGAPYGLLDYAALVDGTPGSRRVDLLVDDVRAGAMPPPAQPQPTGDDRAALLDWATCGQNAGDPGEGPLPGGFDVDRPLLDAPAGPPAGTDFFELRADGFTVSADTSDRYQCFTFAAPVDEPRLIQRVETIVDDARVLHHTVLIPGGEGREPGQSGPCANDNALDLIYAWAPGQGPLHFPDGGIRLEPGERLTLQIHYNNTAGHADVADRSGVRIHHGPITPEAKIYDMLAFGPLGFRVAPRSVGQATGYCVLPQDTTVFASFPHMHEAGVAFEQMIQRADGSVEPFINLDGWQFDSQYLYATPIELSAGDVVTTTCTYRNLDDRVLRSGTATRDEMCFNFAYVTPPLAGRYCNRPELHEPSVYAAGRCAPPDAAALEPPRISGAFSEGAGPDLDGGPWPGAGVWALSGIEMVLSSYDLGPVVLDPDASQASGYGLLWIDDARLTMDALLDLYFTDGLLAFDQAVSISVAGALGEVDEAGQVALAGDCGDIDGDDLELNYAAEDGELRVIIRASQGIDLAIDLRFQPVP